MTRTIKRFQNLMAAKPITVRKPTPTPGHMNTFLKRKAFISLKSMITSSTM